MTGTGAVPQFTGRILEVRILGLFVRSRLVVASMAAGTIRLERREPPLHDLSVALMTLRTLQIAAVVQWFVWQPGVTDIRRGPRVRAVAQTAVLGGIEVPRILTGCLRAVVAGGA